MELTSHRDFTVSFQSLQGHLLRFCHLLYTKVSYIPYKWQSHFLKRQTGELKFLSCLISGILKSCIFLHAVYHTLIPHSEPMITEPVGVEQL